MFEIVRGVMALVTIIGAVPMINAGGVFVSKEIKIETPQSTEQIVREYFENTPVLAEVARCESTFRQTDAEGGVIRGKYNEYDVGIMQINELYHGDSAKKMGHDIYSLEGNLEYAKYLYEKDGLAPWKSSSKCWKGKS